MAIFTGIAAIVGAIGSFIGTLGVVGSFLLQTAVGVGLNLLAKAIAGKPEKPGFSVQGRLQSGGDVPRSFMLGFGATAGSLVYANSWGRADKTPNAYFTQVICLSDLPVGSLAEVWVNGEKVTPITDEAHPDMGYPVQEYRTGGRDHLWIKFHDGTQTAGDEFLVTQVSSTERPYEATRVGVGCPYVIATSLVNEELFTGFPSYKFAINGMRLYDPSRDSTVGGAGTQRWSNPATWGGDGDHLPAVQIYNILRGMSASGQWFYGPQGMTAARLPETNWIAAINKCRTTMTSGGATVSTYRSGGEISVSAPVADAIEALLTACQGRLGETGGIYKLHVGEPGASSFAFTDGEILSTEEQSFTPFFGLADTINGIAAKYPSPAEAWNVKVAPPIYRADLEALAGNRRLMADVSLDLVPYGDQVQRLMKSALLEAQRARRHTLVLPPEFFGVEPGDIVAWTSERNGYISKLMRVDGVVDKANLDVIVDLTEVDPSDYDWDDATDYRVPVDGRVGPLRPPPQRIVLWTVEPDLLFDNAGKSRRPAIKFNWEADISDVKAVTFEVRLAGSAAVAWQGRTDNVDAGSAIVGPFLPRTIYQARGRYIPTSNNRRTEWSDWLPVTTLDVMLGADDIVVELRALQQELREELQRRESEFDQTFDDLRTALANILTRDSKDIVNAQTFEKRIGSNSAKISEERRLRVSDNEAFAEQLTEVTARLTNAESGIAGQATALSVLQGQVTQQGNTITALSTSLTATIARLDTAEGSIAGQATSITQLNSKVTQQGNTITAQASAITAVEAKANQATANGLIGWTAIAAPGGVSARFQLVGKATSGGASHFAGMYLDVLPTSSRTLFLTSRFIITDGTNNGTPFVFEDSELKAAVARIGTVVFDQLRSANGKLIQLGFGTNASFRILS